MTGKFSIVATPIGNLEDITMRAKRVLSECDAVLCEDTRVTSKLLRHYEIEKQLISYHAHSGNAKDEKILALLLEGKHLALVSDAGTPTVSDPGASLVQTVRTSQPETTIEVIPGPSAISAALSVAGVPADSFVFLGFPPHKKGRQTFFSSLANMHHTIVFYESPHRIVKALVALGEHLSKDKRVVICRELTKVHESVVVGTPQDVLTYFTETHPDQVRGEFVVIVAEGDDSKQESTA